MDEADTPERSRFARAGDALVKVGLPAAVLAVIMAVFFGERLGVAHEVQLISPTVAAPGEALPLRALVFEQVDSPYPRLAAVDVQVRLRDASGQVVLEETLSPSAAGGSEGELTMPDAAGAYRVQAIARDGEGDALASAETALTLQPEPPRSAVQGRVAGALQRLSLGEPQPVGEAPPPSVLDARVEGAACVPEAVCEVIVHVGEPAASVRAVQTPSTEPVGEMEPPTAGLTRVRLMTHGPEAVTELEAVREGVAVARRPLQLPTALATPGIALSERVAASGDGLELTAQVLGDRPGIIVDAYLDDRWRHTGSFAPSDDPVALPFDLEPGLWALEVRTDPFSSERAGVLRVAIGESPDVEAAPPGPPSDRFAWLSADHEVRVHPLPHAVSGRDQDLAKLRSRQSLLRTTALASIVLGLIVLTLVFLRRGVDAALQAQRVMDATGDEKLTSARHRRRTLLSAMAIVATVLIAFLGAAALVIARARLLE